MNTPVQIGLPQVILFIIAVLGIGMLISSLMGLFGGRHELELFEDETGRQYRRWRKRRRELRWKRGTSGIIMLILAISLLWLTFAVQSYLGLTNDIKVARVQATSFENDPHNMNLQLTMLDKDGNPTSNKLYNVNGDLWRLECVMVKFPTWMNIFGIHSSYKLTRLEGSYNDSNLERNSKHIVIDLNGGAGDFFNQAHNASWSKPFVDATYGNGVFEPADGKAYDIYVSQTGLYAKLANS
ncbi:hypothetical protein [Dictyobacter kobayashii]|uniref:Uncharacterized protein n=1 Tax=Dictyobacter kobayashii TaxID=2014872 RepID=A0A402ABY7_9CHLR|nr:hypothetical protein [Dictyobacter kobayashii]GCE16605.1 hypothetical protein KDK_04050 [Dictyobacter kobayashii]